MCDSLLDMECDSEFFSTSQLKSRGWTKSLIHRFLGEPCLKRPNPYYRSAAPMSLYRKDHVIDIEQLYSFIQQKAESSLQSKKVKQRVLDRVKNNIDTLSSVDLALCKDSVKSVLSEARNIVKDKQNYIMQSDVNIVEKIVAVGLLFEKASPSMYTIDNSFGMAGVRAMREVMRTRILESININFPELSDVCNQIKEYVDLGRPDLDLEVLAKVNKVH